MLVNDDNAIGVIGQVIAYPSLSTRELSAMAGISLMSTWRILKNHKFHPYKIQLVHELSENDFDRRQEFCDGMCEKLKQNPELLYNICLLDECSFYLNYCVNYHNSRYWSDENQRQYPEIYTQHPQKLNLWDGILGIHIIVPFFIYGNLTGDSYLQLLEEAIQPRIVEIIEQDPRCKDEFIHFQQDGAPPHYAQQIRNYLNNHYKGKWISRICPIEWPARSPDLTPLDYFLWGYLKSKVYATQLANLDKLRRRVIDECRAITPEMLNKVRAKF